MALTDFQSIDEYITTFPEATQRVLETVRRTIQEAAPDAEEKISYQMPTFTLAGKGLVYFAAYKKHIGIYGASSAVEAFPDQLASHVTGKGTLQFSLAEPMPYSLIGEIVKFRAQENLAGAKKAGKV